MRANGIIFIPAAKCHKDGSELERVGIVINADSYSEPLIISAAELYCKWQYDYLGQGERFEKAFSDLRNALSLTSAYTEVNDNGTE